MELYFEKLSRYDREAEPCAAALPFPEGTLRDIARLAILDQGEPVSVQPLVTAWWPDGSVKWLYVDFLATLPGNSGKSFQVVLDHARVPQAETVARIIPGEGGSMLDSGVLKAELCPPGEAGILGKVEGGAIQFEKGSFVGPWLTSESGGEWIARIDDTGWRVVKPGPVAACVQATGKHYNGKGEALLDFEIQVTAYAGQSYLQVDYRLINREEVPEITLQGVEFRFRSGLEVGGTVQTAVATSNYFSKINTGTGEEKLEALIDASYLLYDMNEHIPETFYGTFWADWSRVGQGGVCITQYQAYQNFPKSLKVERQGIECGILPQGSVLTLAQGVAKTHRLLLHFHAAETGVESVNIRSLQFQLPDRPVLRPEVYQAAGVVENIFVENPIARIEESLVNLADSRMKAYGILAWGDAPDNGYTEQGRGNGALVWTNNEYDFPHAAMLLFAKTGQRRFLDYLLVTAWHQMDVDVCHFSGDPLRFQGQITHSAHHVTGKVSPCHEWVEGILDLYHQTGDGRALEVALGIGANVLRLLAQPRYQETGGINARETGWALRTLVALYLETHDSKWLEPAETIVGHFETWKATYGGWLAPYTDHTVIRVPFMIAVAVNSLMRYFRIRPRERIKRMIVEAVEDLVANCRLSNGLFYYKELPSLRRNGNNLLVLEALAYAYELTGEVRFLEAGLPTFHKGSRIALNLGFAKRVIEDAVVVGGEGPKRFAQSFLPLAYYYRVAVKAGVLK